MELKLSHEPGYVLAQTSGPIDDSAEYEIREYLFPLVAEAGTRVVLDMADSKFITSRGIGQLVALVAHANTNASRVVLAACSPFVSVVLSRSRLDKFLEVAASVSEAVGRVSE